MGKEKRKNKKKAKVAAKRKNGVVKDIGGYAGNKKCNQPIGEQSKCSGLSSSAPIETCDFLVNIIPEDGGLPLAFSFKKPTSVLELKRIIERHKGLKPRQQSLRFRGHLLLESQDLIDLLPKNRAWTVTKCIYDFFYLTGTLLKDEISIELTDDLNKMWPLDRRFFDSQYDRDWRDPEAWIGTFKYKNPFGSYLKALKVRDKYADNLWLREGKVGEWSVAYHGTSYDNIQKIVESGSLQEKFARVCAFGPGIYCSPTPEFALSYAPTYYNEGIRYKALLQVRAQLKKVEKVPYIDIWVVPEKYVRIEGICIYCEDDYETSF